jgi:hypothetical protein
MIRSGPAIRFRVAILALVALGFAPDAPTQNLLGVARTPFERRVLRETYAVFPADPFTFYLDFPRRGTFFFYSDADEPAQIECRESVTFAIISQQNETGGIAIGKCPEHVTRLRALMPKAAPGLDRTLGSLSHGPAGREGVERLRLMAGWFYEATPLPDGSSLHYFPVVVIGHGVGAAMTGVLLGGADAIIVQAWIMPHLCEPGRVASTRHLKLCTDTKSGIRDLVLRLR